MLNRINLHNITSISIDNIEEFQRDDGREFYCRTFTFVNNDDEDFKVNLYADNFDSLAIKY